MAKSASFNFGANKKPKKSAKSKGKRSAKGKTGSKSSNAWRSYVGGGPIPD